jgi:hypothetical protein
VKTSHRFAVSALALALLLPLSACQEAPPTAQSQGQQDTEAAFAQQSRAVPYPVNELTDSLERRNVRERLLRTNKPNAIGYLYLLGMNGTYVGYYVIKGKVSSTQSQMTTGDLIVDRCAGGACPVTVGAPGDDGSYGANEGGDTGIYFFLASGPMVTTNAPFWIVSETPLNVSAPLIKK